MITSEVQRTLVKSPPELWAELSDPTSLARHLGELGEIRITRVEPEQRVDWETTGASGSVAIKPSGWGTKVTLTVQHDGRADEPSATSTPEPASGSSPVEATGAAQDSRPLPVEATDAPEASQPSLVEAARAPADPPHAPLEAAAALDSSPESGVEPGPEPDPAPVDIAAPEPATALASWAAAVDAEHSGSTGPAPETRFESATAPVGTGEHELDRHEAAAEPELPPRRGIFDWLFGRRRRHAQVETSLPAAAPTPGPDELPPEDATSALGVSTSEEPPVHELLEVPSPEAEAVAPVAPAPAQPGDDGTAGTDDVASGGESPDVEAPNAAVLDTSADVEAPRTEAPAANAEVETPTTDASANAMADTSNPDAPAAEASPQEPRPHESDGDTEHAAERGVEEVTAVLTAVLDRLGAAHHRPFSRG